MHLLQTENTTGLNIKDKQKLIDGILHQVELGIDLNAELWREATGHVADKIVPRVSADRALLITKNLITANHELKDIEFTGADFHKHGQAPLFLTFKTNDVDNPDPRKIVYKPSNLEVDAQLFGKESSVAKALDDTGTKISQYEILPREDDRHEKYGYMEFVESGGPTTSADLLKVYESLAANMALSYLVGLEDVHQENVLLLKDRVQVIDMEATTGLFKKVHKEPGELDPSQGGFDGQLWLKALNEGIKPKL
jgi:lantibiotic modifying enzyme